MKKYTKTHEWLEIKDGVAYVGISRHAAQELGEIVFVQLPEVGATVAAGAAACEIESVKAVASRTHPNCSPRTPTPGFLPSPPLQRQRD